MAAVLQNGAEFRYNLGFVGATVAIATNRTYELEIVRLERDSIAARRSSVKSLNVSTNWVGRSLCGAVSDRVCRV
ncbi:hypothetical protein Cha6605_4725 [Chamaesiphon minutus PCC 6605]|uniref:Uncharacterized protein n=1 Tax=Chamaesiphon minutus (strain ATCC 27169 / PCC 6605) TaxID=1173020 RepID=K9UMG1_CHAP6|nr:hypothetical protein Cha6605_4725 [Chamaesiphon minutus PCC 6605]